MKKGTIQALFNEIEQFKSLNQVIYGYIRIESGFDFSDYNGSMLRDKRKEISGLIEFNFEQLKSYRTGEHMVSKMISPEILLERDIKAGGGGSILSLNISGSLDDVSDLMFSESSSWLEKQIRDRYIPMDELFLVKYQFTSDVNSNASQCDTILASESINNMMLFGKLNEDTTPLGNMPF